MVLKIDYILGFEKVDDNIYLNCNISYVMWNFEAKHFYLSNDYEAEIFIKDFENIVNGSYISGVRHDSKIIEIDAVLDYGANYDLLKEMNKWVNKIPEDAEKVDKIMETFKEDKEEDEEKNPGDYE